jgi:peptidoglycan/LPS O-acetylase OafA/YrhL
MPWWTYATFTTNIWLSANTSEVFGAALWSLGVEEQFYLTLPLLVYLLPQKHLVPVLLALIAAAPLVRTLLMWTRPELYVHTLVICRADSLLLGVMGALLVRDNAKMEWLTSRRWPLNVTIAVCGSAMCFFLYQNWILGTAGMAYIGYTVLAVFYLALLLAGITRPESRWAWILRNRALRGMGGIAYCAYLMHEPVMAVLFWMNGKYHPSLTGPLDALILMAAFAVTVVVGVLSWRWFEAPLVRMGHRYQYAAVSPSVNSNVKISAAGS